MSSRFELPTGHCVYIYGVKMLLINHMILLRPACMPYRILHFHYFHAQDTWSYMDAPGLIMLHLMLPVFAAFEGGTAAEVWKLTPVHQEAST